MLSGRDLHLQSGPSCALRAPTFHRLPRNLAPARAWELSPEGTRRVTLEPSDSQTFWERVEACLVVFFSSPFKKYIYKMDLHLYTYVYIFIFMIDFGSVLRDHSSWYSEDHMWYH